MVTIFTFNPGVRGGIMGDQPINMEVMAPGTTTVNRYVDMTLVETPSFLKESLADAIVGVCDLRHLSVLSGVDRQRRSEVYR